MRVIQHPTVKHGGAISPTGIVLHDTEGTMPGDLSWLADVAADRAPVSIHYVLDRDGTVYAVVPENLKAWHAGPAHDYGNWNAVGIEIVHRSHHDDYPAAQLHALDELVVSIASRWPIAAVVGHKDICIPKGRKVDPELDPADYSVAKCRARLGKVPTQEEDDMTEQQAADLAAVRKSTQVQSVRSSITNALLAGDRVRAQELNESFYEDWPEADSGLPKGWKAA